MARSKVKQVAALFGKELGEQFKVRDTFSGIEHAAYFNGYGFHLIFADELEDLWFQKLVNGMVEIVGEN